MSDKCSHCGAIDAQWERMPWSKKVNGKYYRTEQCKYCRSSRLLSYNGEIVGQIVDEPESKIVDGLDKHARQIEKENKAILRWDEVSITVEMDPVTHNKTYTIRNPYSGHTLELNEPQARVCADMLTAITGGRKK